MMLTALRSFLVPGADQLLACERVGRRVSGDREGREGEHEQVGDEEPARKRDDGHEETPDGKREPRGRSPGSRASSRRNCGASDRCAP